MPSPEAHIPNEQLQIEDVVSHFINGDNGDMELTISYLRTHRDEIGEFCLQVRDTYLEKDRSTPFLKLSMLIDKLL